MTPLDFNKLSKRQQAILKFMDRYIGKHGYPPTIREIGEATEINSTSVVNYNLNKLVKAGYLERSDRVSRGMRLIAEVPGSKKSPRKTISISEQAIQIPIVGKIVAGEPVQAWTDGGDDFVEVTPMLLGKARSEKVFALEVNGDSMIDAMIADGDIVILQQQETAQNGDMVAVWLDDRGETTLKYYYADEGRVRLQPANPNYEPIMVDAGHCQVQGKVVSVIRQLR